MILLYSLNVTNSDNYVSTLVIFSVFEWLTLWLSWEFDPHQVPHIFGLVLNLS